MISRFRDIKLVFSQDVKVLCFCGSNAFYVYGYQVSPNNPIRPDHKSKMWLWDYGFRVIFLKPINFDPQRLG